ncbi:apurinic/apyrimidinic endonuclease Apn1, partial [Obelidium mucronatum]
MGPKQRSTKRKSNADGAEAPPTPSKKARIAAFAAQTPSDGAALCEQRRAAAPLKWVGPHASAAGGPANAVGYTSRVGGRAFALFLGSQRKWERPPLTDAAVAAFKQQCADNNFNKAHIVPHGSYLINLGNPDAEKRKKGLDAFLEDVSRCERLGIELYNFHPGSTVGECSIEHSISLIAEGINEAIAKTPSVILVIENMAGQGNTVGRTFEELRQIIDLVENKERVGVCLDTCHLFASGYDIRTAEKFDGVMKDFDRIVGLQYLKAMHLNDSMTDLNSGKDRHDHIGNGKIGLEAFRFIMNDDRFNSMPMVLEVPVDPKTEIAIYTREINLLYSLVEDGNKESEKKDQE